MTEQSSPEPLATQPAPASATAAATGTLATPVPGRTKRWLAGAMLVTVGVLAGSGTAYAFTSSPTGDLPDDVSGYGRGVGPMGGPREGSGPVDGTQPDPQSGQGTSDGTTTDGEPT